MAKKVRKIYDADLRAMAVARVSAGESLTAIAKDLSISTPSLISTWKKKMVDAGSTPDTAGRTRDAILYLRNAQRSIMRDVQNGRQPTEAQLLVLLALKTLEGKS